MRRVYKVVCGSMTRYISAPCGDSAGHFFRLCLFCNVPKPEDVHVIEENGKRYIYDGGPHCRTYPDSPTGYLTDSAYIKELFRLDNLLDQCTDLGGAWGGE